MKRICRYLPIFVLLLACLPMATAQSGVDFAVGFGAVQDTAASTGLTIDTNPLSPTYLNFINCPLSNGLLQCSPTSKMNSFVMGFAGDLMFWKHVGIGAEVSFQPAKQDYAVFSNQSTAAFALNTAGFTVKDRVTFYDFNGIYQPVKTERVALKLSGGIGGANIKFYEAGTTSSALTGTQSFSQFFGSSNHFQVHGGAGVQIYVKGKLFIRPQFDVHWVNNMGQFGRSLVTQEMVWIGYTLGAQ